MKYKVSVILLVSFSMIYCASSQKRLEKERANDPQYQYNVGLVYLQNDNYEDAKKYLEKSLSLKPDFDLALNALGIIHFINAEFQEAQIYFERCLKVNPGFTEARNYLGSVYQEMGYLDKAEAEFSKAISDESYASRELPLYNLARLYLFKEKDEEALELVEAALKLNDRMVMAINLKGVLLERLGRLNDAILSYEKALGINPGDVNLSYNLAVAYFKSDRRREAKALFEKIFPDVQDEEMKTKIGEYLEVLK